MRKRTLTAAAVERIKPPAKGQVDHYDRAYPGLVLRVSYGGGKTWVYMYRQGERRRRMKLGALPAMTLADAREAWRDARDAVAKGETPTPPKPKTAVDERDLFENVAEEWLKRDQAKNRTYQESRRIVERELLPTWKGRDIKGIARRDVMELVDKIADRGALTTSRRVQAYIHRLFRWSVGRGIVPINPAADMPKHGKDARRDRWLADAELLLAWNAARDLGWPFGYVAQLLILTGARLDEISSLRWAEIDGDIIRLTGERSKNGKPHDIPLSPVAQGIIEAAPRIEAVDDDGHARPSKFVFTTHGHAGISGWSKGKALLDAKVTELNGGEPIPHWRLHDLRRTIATGMQRLGVNLPTIEAVLGHVSGSRAGIVGVYQRHAYEDEKRAALDAWGRYVELIADAEAWAAVSALLNGDDRQEAMRQRRRFNAAITDGGEAWKAYLASVQSGGAKVVKLDSTQAR